MSKHAVLRVCANANCLWVFRMKKDAPAGCPECNFASYGARYVFGNAAYQYEKTQKPWKDNKIKKYTWGLEERIREVNHDRKNTQPKVN